MCSLLTITTLRQNNVKAVSVFLYNEIQFAFMILVMYHKHTVKPEGVELKKQHKNK